MPRFVLMMVAGLLAGCQTYHDVGGSFQKMDSYSAYETQRDLLASGRTEQGSLRRVQVMVDGQKILVTAKEPVLLGQEKSGVRLAISLATLDPAQQDLILFTRDPGTGKGYLFRRPLQYIHRGDGFTFPVVLDNGTVTAQVQVLSWQ